MAEHDHPSVESAPKGLVIFHGVLKKRRALMWRGFSFSSLGLGWILLFLALPCLSLFVVSFATRGDYGDIQWTFTLENMKHLLGFGFFGWSADNLLILWRSIVVGVVTTFLCVVLSYPLAFFLAMRPARTRTLWLTVLLIPFWTNLVIRTYAWLLALAPGMPLASLLARFEIIQRGEALYPSVFAVYIGMVSVFLPFTALPLYTAVERLDWTLIEAARDLYGKGWRVFRHAILPQTLPGLSVGINLTLIPAMGMFVVPDLMGGAKTVLVGNVIRNQFLTARDWPFGAAAAMLLLLATLAFTLFYTRKAGFDEDLLV